MKNSRSRPKQPSHEAGFTLIEVMIAVAILSIGVLSIGGMQISAMKGNATGRTITEAAVGAADQLETFMSLPWDHADLQDTDGDGENGLGDATVATADRSQVVGQYTIFWNVADELLIENTKTVSVIVIKTGGGVQRHVAMQSVIPRII